jgi:uncharacterized membrane protein YfbV (UPF0208 family)
MSITLTTGKLVAINGVTQENDTVGACTTFSMDFIGNIATFTLQVGSLLAGNLNVGVYSVPITVSLNLTTGAWTSSNGQSGTISGTPLSQFVTMMKNLRNGNEAFCAAQIMPGTQVAW